jgi:ABC-type dipeptide/oligopeptide/nickel transport system ATPase component
LVEDATEVCGLTLLPPDINLSVYRFTPVADAGKKADRIRYGLGAIKGSGQNAIEAIIAARQEKRFTDLFDFVKRVDKRQINRRTIESVIRAGAFDSFGVNRGILLASVGLAEHADRLPSKLSGGQRQRVAIARALVGDPGLVLADEPTAALDKVSGAEVARLLRDLAKSRGVPILMVTHDPRILDIADRVVAMEDGRIVEHTLA